MLRICAASGGVLLVANNPHGSEHLHDLLAGQILWVSYGQLILPAIVTLLIVCILALLHDRVERPGFYVLFALAVTVSVQLVGVYLIFASLIVASLGVRNFSQAKRLPLVFAVGIGGYASGLALSTLYDLPADALIVWCLALLAMAVHGFSPKPADGKAEQTS